MNCSYYGDYLGYLRSDHRTASDNFFRLFILINFDWVLFYIEECRGWPKIFNKISVSTFWKVILVFSIIKSLHRNLSTSMLWSNIGFSKHFQSRAVFVNRLVSQHKLLRVFKKLFKINCFIYSQQRLLLY